MNAISASILVVLIGVVLLAPRRWALLGMAAGVLYLTQYTSVRVFGFNMFPTRFLEMAGIIRVVARREFRISSLNDLDGLFLLFYSYMTVVFLLRSNEGQAYQIGIFVDAAFCYFTFRGLAKDMDDFRWFLRAFVVLLVPYVCFLFVEMRTDHNPFSVLAGSTIAEDFREGRARCVGSFRHPSLTGTLGASFLPLYIGLSFSRHKRAYAIFGIILSLATVWFSNSGGPLSFTVTAIACWLLWSLRDRMRMVRRWGLAGLVALALIMKAPIWYLPTHFSFGGDAWHRSYLMEVAVHHISEWWLCGMAGSGTSDWLPYTLADDTADITNQFIAFGLAAGLMAIALFVWVLVRAFKSLGIKLAAVRMSSIKPSESEYLLWGLGAMLAGHILNFFAICYFDQFSVIWFMQLAAIASVTQGFVNPLGLAMPHLGIKRDPRVYGMNMRHL
ncbi:MAG TPA: hypothetical protein VEF34_04055 [Syntrophobacteraceae bacterium]|nr:hypothetical protein [Syntrophobacteraceae bacterium]